MTAPPSAWNNRQKRDSLVVLCSLLLCNGVYPFQSHPYYTPSQSLLLWQQHRRPLGFREAQQPPSILCAHSDTGRFNHQSRSKARKGAPPLEGSVTSVKKSKNSPSNRGTPQPRPVLTDYDFHRHPRMNRERLDAAIVCPHFGACSGCSTNDQVGNVDVIRSSRLYFSSSAVRRKRKDVLERKMEWSVEDTDADDDFYQVVVPTPVVGWRTQAKLAVAPKTSSWAKDGCTFGLYRRGTHSVLSIPDCAVHHPSINRAVRLLEEATAAVGIAAYDADAREGGLRYVQLQVERSTGKVCLTLVWNADSVKGAQPSLSRLVKDLQRRDPDLWHSVWCHCNDGVGNNIFARNPRRWYRIAGPEFVREPLPVGDHGWLYFSPLTFRQGNLDGFDILAADVARAIPGGSKVCELYAGVGVLGLTALAYHSSSSDVVGADDPLVWVRCSDENPSNPRAFHRATDSLPPHMVGRNDARASSLSQRRFGSNDNNSNDNDDGMTLGDLAALLESGGKGTKSQQQRRGANASYRVATAAQALYSGQALGAQVLIVDPPRKGLEDEVLVELCKPFNPDQPYVESTDYLTMDDERVNWCNDVQTLIYVSCGFDALARDVDKLLSSPAGWILDSATGYVLFPGSDHVETLLILTRK